MAAPARWTALFAVALSTLLPASAAVAAQGYPNRPIRIVVAFPPASSNDMLARFVGGKLGERFGQQVVVDNRAGANGIIGTELAARATPDGHTLLVVSMSHTMNAAVYKLPFDPVNSFTAVSMIGSGPNMLAAHPSFAANTVKELIALAKAKPGQIAYASSGTGGINHFGGELLARTAGIQLVHVPYKGGGPALIDVMGGHVPLIVCTVPLCLPPVKTGKIKALGVGGAKRSVLLPEVPTIAESGYPGYEATNWYAYVAPVKTPKEILVRLNQELVKALSAPEVREQLIGHGLEPMPGSSESLARHIEREYATWGRVVKEAKITAN